LSINPRESAVLESHKFSIKLQ